MKKEKTVIATNKKAYHDYFIEKTYECGIVLTGTEIKSIRRGKVQLRDSYGKLRFGEAYAWNMHISIYEEGNIFNHEPTRTRKLLLHKKEIKELQDAVTSQGYTLIPTKLYLKNGRAKMQLGIAKGKKSYDKREVEKQKDAKRQIAKALKDYNHS
ncbi:tmRNA-binding trans-translation protein [Erysipelotrichaceae bacterium]|nr:tmRNA-binding trans-translation protein [Erysipelotrichaceae bacterium]